MQSSRCAKDGLVSGDYLTSRFSIYQVHSILGSGTYGKVIKCTRMKDNTTVAIKMMKRKCDVSYEVDALKKIKSLDPDKCNLVRWHNIFKDKGKFCLVFEYLDKSLLDFMSERSHPLSLKEIRPIVQQVANALNHLKTVGIVHADLKLENVMLVNQLREPYRVKLIDFGLSVEVSAVEVCLNIQTYSYRSPEIILGLPFTEAIDLWSLGCIAGTMYLGTLLYPGDNEYEVIRYIVKMLGQPPDSMLSCGQKTGQYFQKDVSCTTTFWKLKTPEQVRREMGIKAKKSLVLKFTSLDDLQHIWDFESVSSADKVVEKTDRLAFIDMLKGMLQLDAAKRMTPCEVLDHDFISMHHIASMYHHSNHVRSSFQMMDICENEVTTIDARKTVSGSTKQPSSRSAKLDHLDPPPWAEGSSMVQSRPINSHHCTNIRTRGSYRSGIKGKTHDEDVLPHVSLLANKKSSVGSTPSSCMGQTQICVPSEFGKRGLDPCRISYSKYNMRSHSEKNASAYSASLSTTEYMSQTKKRTSPEVKRSLDLCANSETIYNWLAHKEKRASDHLYTSNSYVSAEVKRSLDHCQTSGSYHNLPVERKASECCAGLPTSNYRSQTRSHVSSEVKGRPNTCQIHRSVYSWSNHDEKRASEYFEGSSTSNCRRETEGYVSPEVKSRMSRHIHKSSDYCSAHKEKTASRCSGGSSTANCRSWGQNCVSLEIKRTLHHQIPESSSIWSAHNGKKARDHSAGLSISNYRSQRWSQTLRKAE